MGMKPTGREKCVEFRVYVEEELKSEVLESLRDVGWDRHEFFEMMFKEWLEIYNAEVKMVKKNDSEELFKTS